MEASKKTFVTYFLLALFSAFIGIMSFLLQGEISFGFGMPASGDIPYLGGIMLVLTVLFSVSYLPICFLVEKLSKSKIKPYIQLMLLVALSIAFATFWLVNFKKRDLSLDFLLRDWSFYTHFLFTAVSFWIGWLWINFRRKEK